MDTRQQIILGGNKQGRQILFDAGMANRHGLITGATGTGKTVTLQLLAESFSRLGVPVFSADVKGDLSGIAAPGREHPKISDRLSRIGLHEHSFEGCPVLFWDLFGQTGHPIRTTVSEMGPIILANLLNLNETQSGILHVAFTVADAQGLLLLDLKDLHTMLGWMVDHRQELAKEYGNFSTPSITTIQRNLLVLKESGGINFFGEPALKIGDLMRTDFSGRGVVSLLDASTLYSSPKIYTSFLLWLLSELMEELPERGDAPLPRLVFFFDEAHLLFDNAPPSLLQRITQVVRLIRSKGVGIFFVSQYPNDIPDEVLGQLGCRIQHALRAFTPKDQKAVRVAAETFRQNPQIDTAAMITELGTGEALISTLDEQGKPTVVDWCLLSPPRSQIGPMESTARQRLFLNSPLQGLYDTPVDRESAYEILTTRTAAQQTPPPPPPPEETSMTDQILHAGKAAWGGGRRQSAGEAFVKSIVRTVGTQIGRSLVRGLLGSLAGRR
ncbi:MAG: helicase HerA-like domain-containing protein [Pseudomonadota bacterium]